MSRRSDPATAERLLAAAAQFGTPLYVYDVDAALARVELLRRLFDGRVDVSYAIKANPHAGLLAAMRPHVDSFDASSWHEVQRALAAGMPSDRISFSGPAKRRVELAGAVDHGVGELVLESVAQAEVAAALAVERGVVQPCLVRINPRRVPRGFGASMAATPSQFGVDEEDLARDLPVIAGLPGLRVDGFHAYSGTNCLDAGSIAENFRIFVDLFRAAAAVTGIQPKRLILGSGFGIPYLPTESDLDHRALPGLVLPLLDELDDDPALSGARPALELGRWLVGPAGWLLTEVVAAKQSRGKQIRMCDAGFNNHLAACGMMGSVLRRNWVYENLSNPEGPVSEYTLVGPLCTTIDRLAADVPLPPTRVGDVIAIPQSGAYGLTASPTRFISHPEPREVLLRQGRVDDAPTSPIDYPRVGGSA